MQPKLIHKYQLINGVKIHWVEGGKPSESPPLVLLHGLADSHLTWLKIVSTLTQERQVIIPDLPGHGLSDRPDASYTLEWYSKVMTDWLTTIELNTVDIAGHSFGGGVAQFMLLTCRERIRRLCLIAAGGLGREISIAIRLASIPFIVENMGQPFMQIGTKIALRIARDGRTIQDIAAISEMNAREGSARAFARTVRDLMSLHGQRYKFQERVDEISELPPIRIFWGNNDKVIPVAHGISLVKEFEGIRLVQFNDCGHYLHHQQPEKLAKVLQGFLNEPTPPIIRRTVNIFQN